MRGDVAMKKILLVEVDGGLTNLVHNVTARPLVESQSL